MGLPTPVSAWKPVGSVLWGQVHGTPWGCAGQAVPPAWAAPPPFCSPAGTLQESRAGGSEQASCPLLCPSLQHQFSFEANTRADLLFKRDH